MIHYDTYLRCEQIEVCAVLFNFRRLYSNSIVHLGREGEGGDAEVYRLVRSGRPSVKTCSADTTVQRETPARLEPPPRGAVTDGL